MELIVIVVGVDDFLFVVVDLLVGKIIVLFGYFGVGKLILVNCFVFEVDWVVGEVIEIGWGWYMLIWLVVLLLGDMLFGFGWVIDILGICLFGLVYI